MAASRNDWSGVLPGTQKHGGAEGSASLILEEQGQGSQNTLLMLPTEITFSHSLLTFIFLLGSTYFYPQDFIACHEMQ